jgi:hypothetical protein
VSFYVHIYSRSLVIHCQHRILLQNGWYTCQAGMAEKAAYSIHFRQSYVHDHHVGCLFFDRIMWRRRRGSGCVSVKERSAMLNIPRATRSFSSAADTSVPSLLFARTCIWKPRPRCSRVLGLQRCLRPGLSHPGQGRSLKGAGEEPPTNAVQLRARPCDKQTGQMMLSLS